MDVEFGHFGEELRAPRQGFRVVGEQEKPAEGEQTDPACSQSHSNKSRHRPSAQDQGRTRTAQRALNSECQLFRSDVSLVMILDITSTPPEFEEHPTTLPRAIDLAQAEETHLLGLKLSRGVLLQVEGQAEGARHIQLSPRVGANVARLSGSELDDTRTRDKS